MPTQGKDYVKDIEKKDRLDSNLQSLQDIDNFKFDEFDKNIEKSFMTFLEKNKKNILSMEDNQKQNLFNGRLDSEVKNLDDFKNDNIAQQIIIPTVFDLQNLETLAELDIFQQQISQQKDKTEQSTTLNVIGVDNLTFSTYNNINKNDIIKELNKDFEDRDKIIDLLKQGKIKDFQKKIGGEIDSNNNKPKNLPEFGTDGKFGKETLDALKRYVQNNKITTTSTGAAGSQTPGAASGAGDKKGTDGGVESGGSSGIQNKVDTGINTKVQKEVKTLDDYGFKKHYSLKLNNKIPLTEHKFSDHTIETNPPHYYQKNLIKIENDGTIQYEAKFAGEDSFTLFIKNSEGKIIHSPSIVIKIQQDKLEDAINTYKTPISKADEKVESLRKKKDIKEIKKDVEATLAELRKEYKDLEKKEERTPEDMSRMQEISVMTKAVFLLEAETHLKEYMKNDHDSLKNKLNTQTCDYYIGGKYIIQDEFMKKLKEKNKNKKLDPDKLMFVGFDINLSSYENIDDYLTDDDDGNKRNFTIKNLIITDDDNLGNGKGLTKDQEIQYKAERYTSREEVDLKSERRALKRILGIKGLFGWGGVDKDMSIATEDYNTNNPVFRERQNLRKLKRALISVLKDEDRSVQTLFQEVAKDYHLGIPPRPSQGADKHRQNVYELYKMYKEDKNCGDYFKKVMGLFENYFVRGLDDFDTIEKEDGGDLFTSIYNQEAIGRTKGLIDPDKRRQAIRRVFRKSKSGEIKLGVDYETSKELRELERLVQKIDLSTYLDDPHASKKHKKFTELYDKYKTSDEKDENGNVKMSENLYYNAAFDFIAGIVEGRRGIVSAINAMKIMDMMGNLELEGTEVGLFDNIEEKKFLMILADYNTDGRVDHGDRGYVMGLTVKNVYKSVKVDKKYLGEEGQNAPWQNLIEFCKIKMKQDDRIALLSDLEKIDTNNLEEVFEEVGKNQGLLDYFKNTLANSPMPIDYIFRYGENASTEYLSFVLPQIESGKLKVEGLDQTFQEEYKKILDQGIEDTPELRAVLKPHFYAGLLMNEGISYGRGGVGLTIDAKKAGQFTMNLGYGELPGVGKGGETGPVLGVMFAYNNSAKLSNNTKFNYGAGISSSTGFGNNLVFLPLVYGKVGITSRLNPNVDLKSLERKSAHYFSTGANVSWLVGSGLGGLGYGVSLAWSRDKMQLVDDQSKTIKEALSGKDGILFKSLKDIDLTKDKENVLSDIKQNLAKEFFKKELNSLNNKDKSTVSKAAENLYSGITYYGTGLDLKKGDKRLTPIIQEIAEAYAIQRRNDAKLDASKWHISSAGISVQMLAGFIPIISVVEFTKYKNLYSKETNKSNANYYEKLITGKGIDFVEKGDFYNKDGYITKDAVEYLNAKLGIAHQNIIAPDLDIELRLKEGESFAEGKNILQIPLDLIKYANINIDSGVANYTNIVEEDGKKYLQVPANAKIALMDYSRLNTAKFHLIVGDNKVKANDIKVSYNTPDFGGEPLDYKGYVKRVDIKKEDVDKKILEINESVANSEYNNNHPFPIKECFKIENNKAIFELKEGFGSKCENLGGRALDITGDSLTVPHTGTLSIVKDGEKYKLYYRSDPASSLVIDYKIAVAGSTIETTEKVEEWNDLKTEKFENTFEQYKDITELFDAIEDDLLKMDQKSSTAYAQFMLYVYDLADGKIDGDDYEKGFGVLKDICDRYTTDLGELRTKMNDENISIEEKVMIVDRFKAIFSYITWLKTPKNLNYLINGANGYAGRKEVYKNLKGYDRTKEYPEFKDDYRKKVVDKLQDHINLIRQKEANLFGMTAFYHRNNKDGKGFSMTQMGSTNTLGGVKEKIKDNDLSLAQDWFLANLNKSEIHKNILKNTFKKQIGLNDYVEMNDDQLLKLLRGESIDIDDKKVILKLDYVFYLLGECANESIGIDLKEISVKVKDEGEGTIEGSGSDIDGSEVTNIEDGHWRAEITGKNIPSGGLYIGTQVAQSQSEYAKKKQVSVAAGFAFKRDSDDQEVEIDPPDNPDDDQEVEIDPPDNPDDDQGVDLVATQHTTKTFDDGTEGGNPGTTEPDIINPGTTESETPNPNIDTSNKPADDQNIEL